MAVDPVCKMQVNESNPPGGKSVYQGQTYYFCSTGCKRSFERDSRRYVGR